MTIKTIVTTASLLLSFALAACSGAAGPDESTGEDEGALRTASTQVTPNETIQWVSCSSIGASCGPGGGTPTNCRVYTSYNQAGAIIAQGQQYTCGGGSN